MRRETLVRLFAMVAFVGLLSSSAPEADAGTTSSASLTATLTVTSAISVSCGTNLAFGGIVSEASADDVTIDPAGVRSGSGYLAQSSHSAGKCTVTGIGSATFTFTLPSSITMTDGASHSIIVDGINSSVTSPATLSSGTLDIPIGGTAHVNPSGVASTNNAYSGTGTVDVAYN